MKIVASGLVALSMTAAAAQLPTELVRRAALLYSGFETVEVRGDVTEPIAGSSWQVAYQDSAWRAQPAFVPAELRASANDWVVSVGVNPHLIRAGSLKDDLPPANWGFTAETFGDFGRVADRLVNARSLGWETIVYKGQKHRCEIVDATYDTSPDFKPKTIYRHRRIYIDPVSLWILRVVDPDHPSGDITFTVTSTSFNQPPPAELMPALRAAAGAPKTKPAWVGHVLPEVTLPDLSGKSVNLADLRGRPVPLDF